MQEQKPQAPSFEGMPESEQQQIKEQHLKMLAIRVEDGLHAQLRYIAQPNGSSITEEIRRVIENRLATDRDDPDLIARAQGARKEIEREAAALQPLSLVSSANQPSLLRQASRPEPLRNLGEAEPQMNKECVWLNPPRT